MSPIDETAQDDSYAEQDNSSNTFRPFEASASSEGKSPSIFDKLDRQQTPSQVMVAKMDAAAASNIKAATAKMDKRLQRKKGKVFKGV